MATNDQIKARIAAGLWEDRWIGTRAISREQAALAYVPEEDVDHVIDVIKRAANDSACPILNDFEGAQYWPPCWAIVDDPDRVREWIVRHDETALPYDLRE